MRKIFAVLICLSLLALMTSCGGSSGGDGGGGNNSPVTQITSPAEGSIFTVGEVIQFVGSCSDSEDGDLSGGSLVWTSDLDGQIDTGETCSSGTLSAGAHQITLTGTDAEGAEGMDTVAITINAAPASGNLPDTGQTTSYTDTFGEDADYTINPPAYTKLDASGSALDAAAADWTMVRDDVTGLIWEVKTDDDTIHDWGNTYTWQNAQDVLIAQLNSDNFGGYSDWRLPTIKELSSLVHADAFTPVINRAYFPQSVSSAYWSSSSFASNTDLAGGVFFYNGVVSHYNKSDPYYVRAVRGGQSANSLMDNRDGTVSDTATGLMWQQAEAGVMTWEAALAYCETLELAGHDDWRLPNRNELQSIVDYEAYILSIDTVFFPGAVSSAYWSSSSFTSNTVGAWYVRFGTGRVGVYIKSNTYYVRAVRGGSVPPPTDN